MSDYYFAYGSNLNLNQFYRRCPAAKAVGRITLPDYRLVFRGVADIVSAPGLSVEGAIYRITRMCERELDIYEGFPNLYRKEFFVAQIGRKVIDVMFYAMNRETISPPSGGYLTTIREGYDDWDIPHTDLSAAVEHASRSYWQETKRNADSRRDGRKGSDVCGNRKALPRKPAYRQELAQARDF